MSVNYYPVIAQGCYENNVKYISWSYDAPLDVRNIEETLGYPTNYVFLFDKIQVQKYRNQGFERIYHLPLAANINRLDKIIPSSGQRKQFGADISFVGNMYESVYPKLIEPLPDYIKGFLDGLCESQLVLYGCYFLDEMISQDILNVIEEVYAKVYPQAGFHIIKEELSYTMATQITHMERMRIMQALSTLDNTSVALFSNGNFQLPVGIEQRGPVTYDEQMPLVFKSSKINLNITLKCLQSGIPLRALDIMACGGFLLSNYQPELAEYFVNGEDYVSYGSIEEIPEIATYYLNHDNERIAIAQKGYEKICKHFTYEKQVENLFDISGLI